MDDRDELYQAKKAVGDRSQGFTHFINVRMKDKDVLPVYTDHPLHLKFRDDVILPVIDKTNPPFLLAVDYETVPVPGPAAGSLGQAMAMSGWLAFACAMGFILRMKLKSA